MGRRSRIRRSRGSKSESEKRVVCSGRFLFMQSITALQYFKLALGGQSFLFVHSFISVLGTGIIPDFGLHLCSGRRLCVTMPANVGLPQTTALGWIVLGIGASLYAKLVSDLHSQHPS
jgi:hypothetical protein